MKNRKQYFIKYRDILLVSLVFVLVLSFVSVGYAVYNKELKVEATANIQGYGRVITKNLNVIKEEYYRELSSAFSTKITELGCNVVFDFQTRVLSGNSGELVYEAEIYNDGEEYFTYNGVTYTSTTTLFTPRILGIEKGDVLAPGETRKVKIIFFYLIRKVNDYDYSSQCILTFLKGKQNVTKGTITTNAVITDGPNGLKRVEYTVTNLNDDSIKYKFITNNTNFIVVNDAGVETEYNAIVRPEASDTKVFYLKMLDSSKSKTGKIVIEYEDGKKDSREDFEFSSLPAGLTIDMSVEPHIEWNDHYYVNFSITNNTGYNIELWEFTIALKDIDLISYQNYFAGQDTLSEDHKTIHINSINKYWNEGRIVIENGKTTEITKLIILGSLDEITKDNIELMDFKTTATLKDSYTEFWEKK